MAVVTQNVSGVAAIRFILSNASDQFYFTNAVDGQKLRVTFQQDGTGGRLVTSGNCPGIMQPSTTANDDSTQELVYDAQTNTWNGVPQQLAPGSLVLGTTTTTTSIAWQKGIYGISGAAAVTLTITNPVAGPPGVGNDGEIMWFTLLTAHAHVLTMATTQTINGSSTSATFAADIGNSVAMMAFGGKVYLIAGNNITTSAGVTLS